MRSLRVLITADPYIPVPPRLYGGIERVVDLLVRGLAARGHEITPIAHPDSQTDGRLIPYGAPPHVGAGPRSRELWQAGSALWRHRSKVDIVHSFGRLAALVDNDPGVRSAPAEDTFVLRSYPLRSASSRA